MVNSILLGSLTFVYIVVILWLGYMGWKKTRHEDDFMVAGRKIHPVILALSYGATFISTSAIIGFGGVAAQLGMGLIWLTALNIGVGILIAFIFLGKRTREIGKRLGAVTFPDLLGKIYKSRFMQSVTAVIILIGMPLYTAAVLIGGTRFIETTLSIQYDIALIGFCIIVAMYVILGGLIAVMYTDALQGAIMMISMIVLLLLTYVILGPVSSVHAELTSMSHLVPEGLRAAGMTGWTSMPEFGSDIWLTLVTTIILGVGIGVLAQPQLAVRFMTVKDDSSLNRAVFVGGPFILITTGVAYTVGAVSNVYFYRETGQIATAVAGGNVDSIIPMYINSSMPEVFVVIFMLALLAAAMSTLSSLFHTLGTAAGYDFWKNLKQWKIFAKIRENTSSEIVDKGGNEGKQVNKTAFRASQIGTALMIIISVILAYVMPGSIIARATAMFFGLCASAFLPAYVHGLYSRTPSVRAAKVSLLVGAVSWFTWTAFVHVKESQVLGISEFFFGKPAILDGAWQVVDPLIVSLPVAVISLVAVWFVEKRGLFQSTDNKST